MGDRPVTDALNARLRTLPSVSRLAATLALEGRQADGLAARSIDDPDPLTVEVARREIERVREELRRGAGAGVEAEAEAEAEQAVAELPERAQVALARARAPSLRPVINATGVILHTNLGRAPLARAAREAVARVACGYSNLELDLEQGGRGSRQDHVSARAAALTGAAAALAVNNGAAAVLLAAAALAGSGRSLIVSRGQLIEIGGSFRIPEVVAAAGARLVEVGTTNRTRASDYERAVAQERAQGRTVGAILRAHPSNFRTVGFVEEVEIEALCALGPPVIDDLGSGVLGGRYPHASALTALGAEPDARRSVAAGAALVCFSADKLLGGPQAGLLVGEKRSVVTAARHPLARAVRPDKLTLAALEATLVLHRDPVRARREIPVLAMLDRSSQTLEEMAGRLAAALVAAGVLARVIQASARVGGGALPLLELEGPAVWIDPGPGRADRAAAALRRGDPAVIARIAAAGVILDPRTMQEAEIETAASAVATALAGPRAVDDERAAGT